MRRKIDKEVVLWRGYHAGRTPAAFNRLVEFYLPWVRKIAQIKSAKLPEEMDWRDLYQDGCVALLDKIQDFDPSRGAKFRTYALPRIRGAMIDGIRGLDWVPRMVRAAERNGTEKPVAIRQLKPQAYDNSGKETATEFGESDDFLNRMERCDEVRYALRGLSDIERTILTLYYMEDLTMREIAKSLDLSESRVSQITTRAIGFLRARQGLKTGERQRRHNHRAVKSA